MNGTYLKQAIVATLCENANAPKYLQRALIENPEQLAQALSQRVVLTKADFLAADDDGKPFMDTAGAWKNFEKINKIVQLSGQKFTYEDFSAPLSPGSSRTLLDAAKSNSGVAKVFTAEMWKGRFNDMEKLWYQLPSYERSKVATALGDSSSGGAIPIALKRTLLAEEGKTPPEDRLAKAGLKLEDIRKAATEVYAFDDVNRKLAKAGDYLRKEYVLMVDSAGDTMFDGRLNSWNKFSDVLQIMDQHGERLEVQDYTRQLSTSKSLLARAAEQKALNKVFAPEQWTDRLQEMISLWSKVLDAWKVAPMNTRDFDKAYSAAESLTYAKKFLEIDFSGKADLLTPLNEGKEERAVVPLGLKLVWDNFEVIQGKLNENGEKLSLADLRTPSGHMGDSCLIIASKYGAFDKVMEIAKANGEFLSLEDFTAKDAHGNMLITTLAEKQQLSQVFTAGAWAGRVEEMRELWKLVSGQHRKQVDFPQVETGAKQATLKQKRGGTGIKLRPN